MESDTAQNATNANCNKSWDHHYNDAMKFTPSTQRTTDAVWFSRERRHIAHAASVRMCDTAKCYFVPRISHVWLHANNRTYTLNKKNMLQRSVAEHKTADASLRSRKIACSSMARQHRTFGPHMTPPPPQSGCAVHAVTSVSMTIALSKVCFRDVRVWRFAVNGRAQKLEANNVYWPHSVWTPQTASQTNECFVFRRRRRPNHADGSF